MKRGHRSSTALIESFSCSALRQSTANSASFSKANTHKFTLLGMMQALALTHVTLRFPRIASCAVVENP